MPREAPALSVSLVLRAVHRMSAFGACPSVCVTVWLPVAPIFANDPTANTAPGGGGRSGAASAVPPAPPVPAVPPVPAGTCRAARSTCAPRPRSAAGSTPCRPRQMRHLFPRCRLFHSCRPRQLRHLSPPCRPFPPYRPFPCRQPSRRHRRHPRRLPIRRFPPFRRFPRVPPTRRCRNHPPPRFRLHRRFLRSRRSGRHFRLSIRPRHPLRLRRRHRVLAPDAPLAPPRPASMVPPPRPAFPAPPVGGRSSR